MDKLIEFLVHHIYIVIIVVGFLFSIISKAGGRGGPARMPDFSGKENKPTADRQRRKPAEQHPYEAERPHSSSSSSLDSGMQQSGMSREGVSLEMPADRRSPARESLFEPLRQKKTSSPPQRMEDREDSSPLLVPDGDERRKAVLWAEILGPPRAKRPFKRL